MTKQATKKAAKKTAVKKGPKPGPKAGTVLRRTYKEKDYEVTATADGFRMGGKDYTSLTALAKEITGYKAINGRAFFGVNGQK
jgi:hypothetical protein